jgi:hypothetical protein
MAINETDTTCDLAIALAVRADYGLSKIEAETIIKKVREAVQSWRHEATNLEIPRAEQELMAVAFEA